MTIRAALCAGAWLWTRTTCPSPASCIQVRDDERDWEGAAERLLHNFGLSLLVPDAHYAKRRGMGRPHAPQRAPGLLPRTAARLARRTAEPAPRFAGAKARRSSRIHPSTTGWNASWRIASTSPAAPRRSSSAAKRAPSPAAGQIKAPGERHEKDDRHRLDDRSRYVLGWTNTAKIAALEDQSRGRWRPGSASLAGASATQQAAAGRSKARLAMLVQARGVHRLRRNSTGAAVAAGSGRAGRRDAAPGGRLRRAQAA